MCAWPPAQGREYATSRSSCRPEGSRPRSACSSSTCPSGLRPDTHRSCARPASTRSGCDNRNANRSPLRATSRPMTPTAKAPLQSPDTSRTMPWRRLSVRCTPACALPSTVQLPLRRRDAESPVRIVPVRNSPKAPSGRLPAAPFASDIHPACNERSESASPPKRYSVRAPVIPSLCASCRPPYRAVAANAAIRTEPVPRATQSRGWPRCGQSRETDWRMRRCQ